MKYLVIISVIFVFTSTNIFAENINSVTKNKFGETAVSFRFGNNPKVVKLFNGKSIKVISMGPFYFKNGDPPALVLKYETNIVLSNYDELKTEIDQVWRLFKNTAEKHNYSSAVIRAQEPLKGQEVKKGRGHGFVFLKQPDASWSLMK